MSQIDRYLSRMTKTNVWPAAHSVFDAGRALEGAYFDQHNVLRWKSNDQCPMDDMLAAWIVLGLVTREVADATSAARAAETAAFLAAYRAQDRTPDAGQLHEMRNAFGPGTKVVNVVTGITTQL